MTTKRAQVPGEVFTKRPSALDKLTGAAPEADTTPQDSNTVMRHNSDTAMPRATGAGPGPGTGKGAGEKTTFYLRPDQIDKLDELVTSYKRHTGQRKGVNRNDIVRRLIDRADLSMLVGGTPGEDI
jgi:hypothetical protein